MGYPIDMELKGCESTECWTHVVTFNFDLAHDLDLEYSISNFEIAVSREWECRSAWNERDMSWKGGIPTIWPWALILDFQGQILKMLYLKNGGMGGGGGGDWLIKGMWVDRMLHSHCDLNLDLTHDLDLGFSRSVFEITVSQEWRRRSTWNESDRIR